MARKKNLTLIESGYVVRVIIAIRNTKIHALRSHTYRYMHVHTRTLIEVCDGGPQLALVQEDVASAEVSGLVPRHQPDTRTIVLLGLLCSRIPAYTHARIYMHATYHE